MASRPINVVIKGDYSDRDVKRAIRDLKSLETQGSHASRVLSKAHKGLVGFGAGLAASWGISRIAEGLGSAIDAASDLAEAQAKVNVVFGESARDVQAWSRTSASAMLMTQQQALEAAGTYGNLFQAFGIGQEQAKDMSTTLVQLAADLASFNNTSVDDAILALRSGMSGEMEPLKRYGVALTDLRLREEAKNLAIYNGKGVLDSTQKSLAAYSLTMKDTALAQGDVARNMGGWANMTRALGAGVGDLQAAMGTGFLQGFFEQFGDGADSVKGAIEAMQGAEGTVTGLTTALGGLLADGLGWLKDFGRGAMILNYAVAASFRLEQRAIVNLLDVMNVMSDEEAEAQRRVLDLEDAQGQAAIANYDLAMSGRAAAAGAAAAGDAAAGARPGVAGIGDDADTAASKLDHFKKALDRVNGRNIDVGRSRIQLERELAEGPSKTGKRTVVKPGDKKVVFDALGRRHVVHGEGKKSTVSFVTEDDAKMWAYDIAEQAMSTAEDYYTRSKPGDRKRGREVLADTRKELIRRLGKYGVDDPTAFVKGILRTPESAYSTTRQQRVVGRQTGVPARDVTYNFAGLPTTAQQRLVGEQLGVDPKSVTYNFTVDTVKLDHGPAWDQLVKEMQRRVAKSGGRYTYPASMTMGTR